MRRPLTDLELASRAHALKQANQTINRTLAMMEDREGSPLGPERVAELQACAVILRRAENDCWDATTWGRKPAAAAPLK